MHTTYQRVLELQKKTKKERILSRNAHLVRLQRADKTLIETDEEEIAIARQASAILQNWEEKNEDSTKKIISKEDYEDIRKKEIAHTRKVSTHLHQFNSSKLTLTLCDIEGSLRFNRIIIGSGVAATLLYPEIPPEVRKTNPQYSHLPGVLVLDDPANPNIWLKEGTRLMGQPAAIQTPPIFSCKSEHLQLADEPSSDNPYNYVRATDFKDSLLTTQNEFEMPIATLRALRVESRETKGVLDWEYKSEKHRVVVMDIDGQEKHLYTSAIDLCMGLGESKKLASDSIASELEATLVAENRIVYGCDGEKPLKGDVLFYGGSAVNASWIAEILLLNAQPNAKVMGLVSPNVAPLKDISTVLNRLIERACPVIPQALGTIKEIKRHEDRLAVTFCEPNTYSSEYPNYNGVTIICDQFVYSRGQVNAAMLPLVKDFSDFEICYDESKTIPLGTHSKDGTIATWGAAGSLGIGLTASERADMVKLVAQHANTTLVENNAMGGISRSSWTIPKMAERLGARRMFPISPGHRPHAFEIPRINQASLHELMSLFTNEGSLDEEKSREFAQAVINERLRKIPDSVEPTGIHSINRLKGILPPELLVIVEDRYFPTFKIKDKIRPKKLPAYKPLSWLGIERVTSDADVFVSQAQVHDEGDEESMRRDSSITLSASA